MWLKDKKGLGSYLDLLRDDTFRDRGYFNQNVVDKIIREHLEDVSDHVEVLWGLLNFEMWCRLFIDKNVSVG